MTENSNPNSTAVMETKQFAALFPYSAGLAGISQDSNFLYVHISIITFCVLIAFTFGMKLWKRTIAWLRLLTVRDWLTNQDYFSFNQTEIGPWLKKNLLYAPLWNVRHNREFQMSRAYNMGTLPSRGHMFLLVAYFVTNLAFCFDVTYGHGEPAESTVAQLRGRTGTLAALNMVPTVLFAMRNNPLIWILQVPYDTWNLFHRWLARLTILESILHVLFWAGNTVNAGGWEAVREGLRVGPHARSFMNGLVGAVLMCVIAVQAWSPIRHAFYETFLKIHKLAVIITLVTVYLHLKLDNLPQTPWLVLAFCIYGFEYFCRLARILHYNFHFSMRGQAMTGCEITRLNGEAVRLTFTLARYMYLEPGSHIHVYIPYFNWFGSHPFSIAWGDHGMLVELNRQAQQQDQWDIHEKDRWYRKQAKPYLQRGTWANRIHVVARARTGFTRDLYNWAQNAAGNASEEDKSFNAMVEGPYGARESFASYGTVLLFAGGIGITHQLLHINQILNGPDFGLKVTRKIVLIWSMTDESALDWCQPWMDEILSAPGRVGRLKIKCFVTRPQHANPFQSNSEQVSVHTGRCRPGRIIRETFENRTGAMVVSVCGPGAFADDVRAWARPWVQEGVVDFVEEAFTY